MERPTRASPLRGRSAQARAARAFTLRLLVCTSTPQQVKEQAMNTGIRIAVALCALLLAAPLVCAQERDDLSGHWRVPSEDGPKGAVQISNRQSDGEGADSYTLMFEVPGGETIRRHGNFDGQTLTVTLPTEHPVIREGAESNASDRRGARGALEGEEAGADGPTRAPDQADEGPGEVPLTGTYTLSATEIRLPKTWLLGRRQQVPMQIFQTQGTVNSKGALPVQRFGRAVVALTIVPGKGAKDPAGVAPGEKAYYSLKIEPDTRGEVSWSCADEGVSIKTKGETQCRIRARGQAGRTITLEASFASATGSVHTAQLEVQVRPAIETIAVASVTFSSDHGLLTDNAKTWGNLGKKIPEPEWTAKAQHPISHTMNERVKLRVTLDVKPKGAVPQKGKLVGKGPNGLKFKADVTFKAGEVTVTLDSGSTKLAKKLQKLDLALEWSVKGVEGIGALSTTHTPTFVTLDTPRTPTRRPGVTVKRMEKAIAATSIPASTDPPKIVKSVIGTWSRYNLKVAYSNAWELGSDKKDPTTGKLVGADCQTIVRFTQNVISMVGVPGTAEFVVVWAKVASPTKGEESLNARNHMTRPPQWHPDRKTDASKKRWAAALVDKSGGLNNYEAALRFTHGGKRYYPGGVDAVFKNPDQVVKVFTTMSWVDFDDVEAGPQEHIFRYRGR